MIPKIIHYCWFSGEKKPKLIRKCIKSWRKNMPDYQIKCWDANSFDFSSVPYVEQAIKARKWAFATDYVRLYALYTEGGIYLDTDVEVFRSLDDFLKYSFFSGTDVLRLNPYTIAGIESAIMGAEKGSICIRECMKYYENRNFIKSDGSFDLTIIPSIMSDIFEKYGYKKSDEVQFLHDNIAIFSTEYFTNTNSSTLRNRNYAHHYNTNAWLFSHRGRFFFFCRKYKLMRIYYILEYIHKYIR